jgi:hypothetical protein
VISDYDDQESEADTGSRCREAVEKAKGKGKEEARGKRSIVEDPTEAAGCVLKNAPQRRVTATRKRKTASKSSWET